jgi:hypothetical protein
VKGNVECSHGYFWILYLKVRIKKNAPEELFSGFFYCVGRISTTHFCGKIRPGHTTR